MKICVTTSDAYSHIVPIFCYLFNKNWDSNQAVELVGYTPPSFELPPNFSFVSLGAQGGHPSCFSNDLRKYFKRQDEWILWLFEDSFIVQVEQDKLDVAASLTKRKHVGRINLTRSGLVEEHEMYSKEGEFDIYINTQQSNYRLSTQPSIWNRDYLLQYLRPGLTPWQFETQEATNDGWNILGMYDYPIVHNEGVRKNDLYAYNLNGISNEHMEEMRQLKLI